MKKLSHIAFTLTAVLLCSSVIAQDASFSQYFSNSIYLNPSLTAVEDRTTLGLNYRNQWANHPASYKTVAANFETAIKSSNSAIGIQFIKDEEGKNTIVTNSLQLAYRYRIKINSGLHINAGLQVGLGQRSLNVNQLVFEDQLDRREGNVRATDENFSNDQKLYPDISTGVMVFTKFMYVGFSTHHLNEPTISFQTNSNRNLNAKYGIQMGTKIALGNTYKKNSYYSPNLILQQQGSFRTISLGNYFKHKSITSGIWYRWKDAVVVALGVEFDNFRTAYSIDLNTNNQLNTGPSHEISIAYTIPSKIKKRRSRKDELVFCPKF